jgi:hypothetical protein
VVSISFYNLFIALTLTFFTTKSQGQYISPHSFKAVSAYTDSVKTLSKVPFTFQKDNYVKNLAFFCRQEWKLEKALKVPFRFRVGSLEQCNLLEGKK